MTVNSLNALMFGSDDDSVYLAEYTPALAAQLADLDFNSAIPAGMIDCGWISEEGMALDLSDSVEKIRGHQGNAVVKEFMSSSDTTLNANLLESKLEIVKWNLDATVEKKTAAGKDYAEFNAPASRTVKNLCAVIDAFETTGSGSKWRLILTHVTLGARSSVALKAKELTAWQYALGVLGGFRLLTDAPAMIPGTVTVPETP
ncbi:hypothetical protein EG850_10960 [Gulosibacter macacae]|uniref:Phage tail protein n=1 Tax=Gulosibacter macacae TaxID=2488791 RepID=A0A3P3VSX9_9MICO|nr:hypothetical protein [Gulosibacter macacae]RRJ85901.1 hypothetical protein EG850_10960 [Gulosibacter macacae]